MSQSDPNPNQFRRYGEKRFRYVSGALAPVRYTQTFVREDEETVEHFMGNVLHWCRVFDQVKAPGEHVDLVESWHDNRLTRATIIIEQPDQDISMLRQLLEELRDMILTPLARFGGRKAA